MEVLKTNLFGEICPESISGLFWTTNLSKVLHKLIFVLSVNKITVDNFDYCCGNKVLKNHLNCGLGARFGLISWSQVGTVMGIRIAHFRARANQTTMLKTTNEKPLFLSIQSAICISVRFDFIEPIFLRQSAYPPTII